MIAWVSARTLVITGPPVYSLVIPSNATVWTTIQMVASSIAAAGVPLNPPGPGGDPTGEGTVQDGQRVGRPPRNEEIHRKECAHPL